jgi:LuxR family maltose regulon positive regulatory protein
MNSPVLKTKLFIPPLQPRLVPRPRLNDQMNIALRSGARFTLVAAPAGFGKTTAISNWVNQTNHRAAWVSLDENDNEPPVFWTYVIAAFRTIWPDFGAALNEKLAASAPPSTESILPQLVNQLTELAHPLILVLDDYHVISNPEIHAGLAFLLNHQPPQLHLVVVTRADPHLPIARLRAHRTLAELRAEDLRFTLEEARIFLNEIMRLGLTAEDIALLERRTEGWGVGLVLAAQSMQGRSDKHEFISAFSGSHHYILEYLIEEILNYQPDLRREFLLRTSTLEQLCGPLCDAVTGTQAGAETLAQLHKENLFISPLDMDHTWYRYHPLFGELLADHLQREFTQVEIQELHRRASHWYERQQSLEKALKYALRGQDHERAAALIEQIAGRVIARGQVKTLLQWIDALPEEVVKGHPRLLMRLGWSTFLSGKVSQASRILTEARQALDAIPAGPDRDVLQGKLLAMLSTLTALTPDLPRAIAQAEQALEKLPEGELNYRARAMRALGVCHLFLGDKEVTLEHLEEAKTLALDGQNKFLASEILSQLATLRKHQGKLKQAFQTYRQILDFYDSPEESPPACLGFIGMAEIALEWNDLLSAEKYLDTGIELCYKGNIGYPLQPAYLMQGLLRKAKGDRNGALEAVGKGENLSRIGGGSLESVLGLASFQVRLNLQLGELDRARQWAMGELLPPGLSFDALPPVLHEIQQSLLAGVYLRTCATERILEIYDRLCEPARAAGRMARVIELSLFKALALQKAGRQAEALEVFTNCLELAEPQAYVRFFLEAGELVRNLLQQAAASGPQTHYAASLLNALGDPQPVAIPLPANASTPQPLVEPLTRRELDVLRLICQGCSNQEIAAALIVSVNTIKKHTNNIYGKLGVRNRAQAILRVQEIALI